MQRYLGGLTALHSAEMQAVGSRVLGRTVRREPVTTVHPLVRTNPVTGWNSIFFNPGFVTEIVGIPKAESNAIINYLNEIVSTTQEAHVRYQWQVDAGISCYRFPMTLRHDFNPAGRKANADCCDH